MVTRPQPGLEGDRDTFRTLARHHGGCFGAWAAVSMGGTIRVGDDVVVEPLVVSQRRSDEAVSLETT